MFRMRREDRAALVERLYDAHGVALYRYALMLLGDRASAEDVVHQVFTTVLGRADVIESEQNYLRRAVRNEAYTLLRRGRTREAARGPLLEPVAAGGVAPEERIALERAILALPADQREVIHLHVFEGMTLQETADAADESINTIASRYRYAIEKLRAALRGAPEKAK
jgi:RNA polymerase sigma-70 factor (ECF subfamily)